MVAGGKLVLVGELTVSGTPNVIGEAVVFYSPIEICI